MTDEKRQFFAQLAVSPMAVCHSDERQDGKREQDLSAFRFTRLPGGGTVAIPPRRRP